MTALDSKPIRLGFIGLSETGWAATALAPPLFKEPLSSKYSLVAVSTTKPESAKASAAKYSELASKATGAKVNVKPYHGSAEHIAADNDVDLVVVSVKVMDHKDPAMKVIEAGKDLFIEWPAGRHLAETKELYEATQKRGIKTIVGFQARFAGYALKAKSLIDSGELGKVISSTFIVSFSSIWGPVTPDSIQYLLDSSNGATLLDVGGGHALDLLTYILGPITSLSAVVQNQVPFSTIISLASGKPTGEVVPNSGPTQICVSGVLKSGTVFTVHLQSGVKETEFNWIIHGEKGTLRINDSDPTKRGFFDATPEVRLNGEKIELPAEESRTGLAWEAFADRKQTYADLGQALKIKEIMDAILRSSKEGKRVDF